ncbi:uncharacterized protein B0P05DRAFT_552468 [Gilbertella persicaria]|uniref:RlpA-like protein double-psi beta-barrel domain-containing protein n=1 Tax=Rhizopus stolonifer TaxID=4846 RepID=A0A367J2K9_RHIST|nr:uncharacterized protein B0P05DRAFT_552468 [Gilbertella persicaria]KAI8067665.1 hypothetical protein B0P05DRAFT_552468 [Gilbertella persicaria]RCH84184.1 hypothetical protein CU098_009110 [Rhizopus stolonifer]
MLVHCFWLTLLFIVQMGSTAPTLDRRLLGAHRLLKGDKKIKTFTGLGTHYDVGSGSCGEFDTNSDLVVAVNKAQMQNGPNPNKNPHCYQMVSIRGDMGNVVAKVTDTCPACGEGSLDMSPSVYEIVCGTLASGVCHITWNFL